MLPNFIEMIATERLRLAFLSRPSVFLGGAIDNGAAVDWQKRVASEWRAKDEKLVFLNPRRADWDPDPTEGEMREQIYWELDALESANAIIIYFPEGSLAPISLMELGLFAHSEKVIVVCSPGYWRKANVEVVCSRYSIPMVEDLDEGMEKVVALAKKRFAR